VSYDKRAVKILFDAYWGPKGWKAKEERRTPPEDLAHAIRAGLMFPPCRLSHQDLQERILALRNQVQPRRVGSAFVASLSGNQLALRSALGSYAVALHMPMHALSPRAGALKQCAICGDYESAGEQDVNVLNFERHKWGGVRHEHPDYIAFDLERFSVETCDPPTKADREVLHTVLATIESMPHGAKLSDLLKKVSPLLPGNDAQRRTVIGILGFAGVIRIPHRSGFFRSFTSESEREHTPWSKDDWPYPIRWWRGGNGVDREAVAFWFDEE
jgi:hypothetical protein